MIDAPGKSQCLLYRHGLYITMKIKNKDISQANGLAGKATDK